MLTDRATAEATQNFFSKQSLDAAMVRGFDGLSVSALAAGTYLGSLDDADDRRYENALVAAAQGGINLFDTAVNYRCQRSERTIAYVIKKLGGLGIARNQLVISSKGGFLPGDSTMDGYQDYVYKSYIKTSIIKPEDIVANCHCMTPKYITSQINQSLANLRIKTIDLYYIHNPEIQLPEVGQVEFYKRLTAAFAACEQAVSEGKIARYGVATWDGFRQALGAADRLDINDVLTAAKDAGGEGHHFRAIQLPYNMAMLEAVGIRNQKVAAEEWPIIAAATQKGVAVMISAPLMQGHVLKLPTSMVQKLPGEESVAAKALRFVVSSPGVVSAMVGMREISHVQEVTQVLKSKPWDIDTLQKVAQALVRG